MSARRAEILTIAGELFAERGYALTSMRDIADASGMLAGSLYSHFRSKTAMLEGICELFYVDLLPGARAIVDADASGASKVRTMLHHVADTVSEHRLAMSILHYDWRQIRAIPELAHVVEHSMESLELWRLSLLAGIDDGSLRSDVYPELITRMLPSAVHAIVDAYKYPERSALLVTHTIEDVYVTLEQTVLAGLLLDRALPPLIDLRYQMRRS
jgi:TetR/AcrR family transcriptional regulator, cholesterol catabolism regulator